MGFKLEIAGAEYEAKDFSVQEASTPLSAGDSSGAVGSFTFSTPYPDEFVTPNHPLLKYGVNLLIGKNVRLADSRKGFTLGRVTSVTRNQASASIDITATSRLGELNVFNVQAAPFVGRLEQAFENYLALAGVDNDFFVDPSLAGTPVVFPGWTGELWFHLKQMAVAVNCDVSLVSGVILLRPLRSRVATRGRDLGRSSSVGGGTLAQNVEVIQYNNTPITNKLVYPPGGWSEEVTVFQVNAGETIQEELVLSASVTSVQQPVMQTFVSKAHDTSSVFTVVGDDGLPITPAAWSANGGSLRVSINPDTVTLQLDITAPTRLPNKEGKPIQSYGISLSSENNTGRYSTLRIIGSGVAFDKESVRVPTGASERETATEVGVTIDNPFLSTRDEVYSAGLWAARAFDGSAMTLQGSVTAINKLGDTGGLTLRTYDYVQQLFNSQTYAQVQTLNAGKSYADIEAEINSGTDDDTENQVFGNVAGARIWDKETARWYRIRSGTLAPGTIQFDAEDDLLHSDTRAFFVNQTYADMQVLYNGFSYREVDLMGLRGVEPGIPYPALDLFPSLNLFPAES